MRGRLLTRKQDGAFFRVALIKRRSRLKGFKDAVADLSTIKAWWAKWPHAEIGWAIPEGLLAVDLDEKHGFHGTRDFAQLTGVEADDYPAPSTVSPAAGGACFFGTNGKTYGNLEVSTVSVSTSARRIKAMSVFPAPATAGAG